MVENTVPYYEPLIKGQESMGHIWWSNFHIRETAFNGRGHRDGTVESLATKKQVDLSKYDIKDKRKILRNCVEPEIGKHIFDCAFKYKQGDLF